MSVPEYHVHMETKDLRWLKGHMGTERSFPAELRVGDAKYPGWITYRGRFSRRFAKPSFDFSCRPGHLFDGQVRLHLTAAYRDPSLLRGRMTHELFADLGVVTPRATHVWLTFNGRPVGLYTAYEALDEHWLQRYQWPSTTIYYGVGGEGNLGLINPRTGRPKKRLAAGFEKIHPDDDTTRELEDLIYAIALPDEREFPTVIEREVDVDACLRWLCGVIYSSHTDGLAHNYALLRPQGGRWVLSPWDCDGTWGRGPNGSRVPADWLPITGGGDNYLIARLMATPSIRQRYHGIFGQLLETILAPERCLAQMERLHAEIAPLVRQDGNKGYSDATFAREPDYIRRWLGERLQMVREALSESPATGV